MSGKYAKGTPAGSRATLPDYEWLRKNTITSENIEKVKRLEPIAKELDCTLAQLSLAWCLKNEHVSTVITGASRPEQVTENMKAVEVAPRLDSDTLGKIDVILGTEPQESSDD